MSSEAKKYFGDWETWEQMRGDWSDDGVPTDEQVVIAEYTYEDYRGDAFVIFERDGRLWENHGGHCSCYGLEGQWEPEETTWAAIAMRPRPTRTAEGAERMRALLAEHNPAQAAVDEGSARG